MERKSPAIGREGQVAWFIQHDGVVVEQAVRQMPGAPRAPFGLVQSDKPKGAELIMMSSGFTPFCSGKASRILLVVRGYT